MLTYAERLRAVLSLVLTSPSYWIWHAFFPLAGVVLIVLGARSQLPISAYYWVTVAACFGFSPFLILLVTFNAHRTARKQGPYVYRFDEAGLYLANATSELKQSWAAIPRVRASGGILLLYFSKHCAHCVPLRALGGSEVAACVMRLASAAGVPRVGN